MSSQVNLEKLDNYLMDTKNLFLDVDGVRVSYLRFGKSKSAKKLVILHGWNINGYQSWLDFISLFKKRLEDEFLQIIALDLPGFANSNPPSSVWGVIEYADFLKQFLDLVGWVDNVEIIGHSFGGAISSVFTSKYPGIVNKLYLVAPAIIRENHTKKIGIVTKITKSAKKYTKSPIIKKIWYKIIGSPDYGKVSGIMKEIFQKVIKQDVRNYLNSINIKTVIVWGDKDTYTPVYQAKIIHGLLVDSKLHILHGINHGVHIHAFEELKKIYDTYSLN